MKNIIKISIILSVFFSSCYKYSDDSKLVSNNNTNNSTDSVYLKMIEYVLNTNDTIRETFYYDAQKRISSLEIKDVSNSDTENIYFFYNGNLRLPFKDSIYYTPTLSQVHLYEFDLNGRLTKDSLLSNNETKYYTYLSNKMYIRTFNYNTLLIWNNSDSDTITIDNSNNPTTYKQWSINQNFQRTEASFTFDNKTSAFTKIDFLPGYFWFDNATDIISKNGNPTFIHKKFNILPTTPTEHSNCIITYQYNSNNMPTSSIYSYTGSSSPSTIKYRYFYTAL
jgi:hypothetical protein